MINRKLLLAAAAAGVTALTTAGSIYVMFYLMIDVFDLPASISGAPLRVLLYPLLIPLPFIAGGLWGAGIAFLTRRPARPAAKTMARTWGGIFIVVTLMLDLTQIPAFGSLALLGRIPHILHYLFTLAFVPAVAIVVVLNTRKLLTVLEVDDLKMPASLWSGAAAAGAFLIASLALLFGPGWEVAGPLAGRDYSMITIMHICNFTAALAGGLVLGWILADNTVKHSFISAPIVESRFSPET